MLCAQASSSEVGVDPFLPIRMCDADSPDRYTLILLYTHCVAVGSHETRSLSLSLSIECDWYHPWGGSVGVMCTYVTITVYVILYSMPSLWHLILSLDSISFPLMNALHLPRTNRRVGLLLILACISLTTSTWVVIEWGDEWGCISANFTYHAPLPFRP